MNHKSRFSSLHPVIGGEAHRMLPISLPFLFEIGLPPLRALAPRHRRRAADHCSRRSRFGRPHPSSVISPILNDDTSRIEFLWSRDAESHRPTPRKRACLRHARNLVAIRHHALFTRLDAIFHDNRDNGLSAWIASQLYGFPSSMHLHFSARRFFPRPRSLPSSVILQFKLFHGHQIVFVPFRRCTFCCRAISALHG